MHHKRFTLTILAVFVLTLVLHSNWHTTIAVANEEAAIRAVLTRYAAGYETGELAAIEKLWLRDETVSVAEAGSFNHGWTDFRDHHLGPELGAMKNVKFPFEDIRIHVNGKLAWVTFNYKMSGESRGRAFDNAGAATLVLEKRGSDWLVVHQHTSAKRRPAAPVPAKPPEK